MDYSTRNELKTARKSILLASLALSTMPVDSIADDLQHQDAGTWMQVVGEGSLALLDPGLKQARIWLEGQSHWEDNWNQWSQGLARVALGYSISPRTTIWLGYTWSLSQSSAKPSVSEQDVWPSFRYVLPTEYGTLAYRIMLESNFIKGSDVRFRPRQLFRFAHPFEFEPRLSLVLWDEFFFRVNSTHFGGQSGYDQNRAFIGANWVFNPSLNAELGYLNQDVDDAQHEINSMHHLIQGSLFFSF